MGTACTSYCSKSDEQNEVNDDDSQQSNKVTTIEKQTAPEVRASQVSFNLVFITTFLDSKGFKIRSSTS